MDAVGAIHELPLHFIQNWLGRTVVCPYGSPATANITCSQAWRAHV